MGWPSIAHTMIGMKRLDNLQELTEKVLDENVPGDFIETGVWRGGAVILMRAILKERGITDRKVFAADTFAGLPKPNTAAYPEDAADTYWKHGDVLAVSRFQVKDNFYKYDLLDDQVIFLEGLFKDTLPQAPIEKLALMRLDGDMYESTMDALRNLYPKLSVGGYCIIDDFGALFRCRKAVFDYREVCGITEPMIVVDGSGVYWRKER